METWENTEVPNVNQKHVHATNLVVKIPKSYGMSEKFKEDIRRTIREEL